LTISEASLYLICAALMAKWYISFMKKLLLSAKP